MPIPHLPFAPVLVFKEIADFIQIGMIAFQQKKRFSGSRSVTGGTVGIEGETVRVNIGGVQTVMHIEEAASIAGVAGAGGRGKKPAPAELPGLAEAIGGEVQRTLGFVSSFERERRELVERGRGLELLTAPGLGMLVGRAVTRPTAEGVQAAAAGPDRDATPFSLREFVLVQEYGKDKRQERAIRGEAEAAAFAALGRDRLAALDAQIAREQLAAQTDIARERIVTSLLQSREQIAAQFGLQRERLETQLELQKREHGAEERQLDQQFNLQGQLQEAERTWKTEESEKDRQWRAKQAREAEDWGYYWKNAAADRALSRSLEAARGIASILREIGGATRPVVDFAQAFARGGS